MRKRTPLITSILIAINVAIFLIGAFNEQQMLFFARYFDLFAPGTLAGEVWRPLTATFLHAGPLHIGMNMLALWYLGSVAENLFGAKRYLAIYLLSGVLGFGLSLLSKVFLPESFLTHSVGASGAIFGLAGALLGQLWIQARSREEFLQNPFVRNVGFNLLLLIGLSASGLLRLDNYAHIGGLLAGAALAVLLRPARALPKTSPEKVRLSIVILVLLGLATAYSLYPMGTPGFVQYHNAKKIHEIFTRGGTAFDAGNFAEARDAFQEVILMEPLEVSAMYNLALSYKNLGDRANAARAFQELEALLAKRPGLETKQITVEIVRRHIEILSSDPKE